MNKIELEFAKLHPDAVIPTKTKGNIGLDLVCIEDVTLRPGERKTVRTGLAVDIPEGYAIIFKDRSGNAAKRGLHILAGVIDSSYTGELLVCVCRLDLYQGQMLLFDYDLNHCIKNNQYDANYITIKKGERICQMILVPDYDVTIIETPEINKQTERADKGFGSSGL